MKKFQAPVLGGFRKMITLPPTTVGTTIAEIGGGTITLSQLAAAINNILTGSGTTTTGTANAANLVVGPGLTGGGPLVGNVPLRITAPIPWGMVDDGVDGDQGPQGVPGPRGLQGVPGQFLMPEDGQDGDWGPPGAAGAVGATGAQGPQGPAGSGTGSGGTGTLMMFIPDDHSFDDVLTMPGPIGPQGATGAAGPAGVAGPTLHILSEDTSYDDIVQFGAPSVGANPTAQVGLTAVNGKLTTYLRSDAAPALSQSISPTWTGNHTFNPAGGSTVFDGIANNAAVVIDAATTTSQSFGIFMQAGTNAADFAFAIANGGNTAQLLKLFGDGGLTVGGTAVADEGAGTINVSGGYYINGVLSSGPQGPQGPQGTTGATGAAAPGGAYFLADDPTNDDGLPNVAPSGTLNLVGGPIRLPYAALSSAVTQTFTGTANFKNTATASTSTTLTADPSLTIACNEAGWYSFNAVLYIYETTLGTGGIQFDLNGGTAVLDTKSFFGNLGVSAGAAYTNGSRSVTATSSFTPITTNSASPDYSVFQGVIHVLTPGTFGFRWSQASLLAADATNVTTGSFVSLLKIG
jgi:hypothetical protein